MLLRRFFDFEQIGGTWNGDGLSEVLDKRLKLNDFQEVSYTSSNASWVLLRRTRRNSATENDLLKDVRHEWEAPKGKSKKKKKKKRDNEGETKSSRRDAPKPPSTPRF